MSDDKLGWKIESEETLADYVAFKVRRVMARPPNGDRTLPFHVVDTPHCVQTVAVTDDDQVILVQQYRQGIAKVVFEFPGGIIDDGEDCGEAGLRELNEETGYSAQRHEVIGSFASDPALNSNRITIVAAYGCKKTNGKHEDEGEAVVTRLVPRAEMEDLIERGEIDFGDAIAAWYLFNRRGRCEGPVQDSAST